MHLIRIRDGKEWYTACLGVQRKSTLSLTYELIILLNEVDTIINSRKLIKISYDVNDLEALMPDHFLLGRVDRDVPMGVFNDHDLWS